MISHDRCPSEFDVSRPTFSLLFYCVLFDDGPTRHRRFTVDPRIVEDHPHLFAICVIDRRSSPEAMLSGALVKSARNSDDPAFLTGLGALLDSVPGFCDNLSAETYLQVSEVELTAQRCPSSAQYLRMFQALKNHHRCEQAMLPKGFDPASALGWS